MGKRVDTPLITINAMVRVGPWTVEHVHHGNWRKCDRCETDHNEVWVCTVHADDRAIASRLDGKRSWRSGSTCGPTLMLVSDIEWAGKTKDLKRMVRLAVDAARAIEGARKTKYRWLFLHLIEQWLPQLLQGMLTSHYQRVLRSHVNGVLSTLRGHLQGHAAGLTLKGCPAVEEDWEAIGSV